ncbi:MAG: carbohydrate-binding family 9-like protein [Fimbriimonas sp.]|nr:carbohydrate-binding family 9-like protein [Fimbriimonas sp.]
MRTYRATRQEGIGTLNGRLDKSPWTACEWSDDFVDIEGDIRPTPRHRTRMKMFWAEDGLYIGAEMEEPHLWATLTEHDSVIFHDNDFEVFLDPDNDGLAYAELEINALNTTWDLLLIRPYYEQGRGVDGWEIQGLRTAVHLEGTLNDPADTDKGWSLEIHIPWHALWEISKGEVPPAPGDRWKINFSRVQWHLDVVDGQYQKRPGLPEDNWVWSPQGMVDMHQPERWGLVEFVD